MDLKHFLEKEKKILIAFPFAVDSNVIGEIIADKLGKKVKNISFNEGKNKKSLTYDDFFLKKYEKYTLIFDSLETIHGLIGMDGINELSENNKLIFLFTLGISNEIISKFNGSEILNAKFSDFGMNINFELYESKMTQIQTISYLEEEDDVYNLKKQRKCNIYIKNKNIDMKEIFENSEKFSSLLKNLILNKEKRHFLFTRYRNEYGISTLEKILLHYKFNVFIISNKNNFDENEAIINNFNNKEGECILLSNIVPILPLKKITEIHMIDGSLSNTLIILNKIYKYYNYENLDKAPELILNFYVCQLIKSKKKAKDSIDVISYLKESEKLKNDLDFFNKIIYYSKPIIVSSEDLMVTL